MKLRFEDLLLKEGILKENELEEIKKIQKKSSADLTQILVKKGILDDVKIAQLRARQFSFPFINKIDFKPDNSFKSIPLSLVQKYRMVPILKKGKTITVAISDPTEIHAMDDLQKSLRGFRIAFAVTTESEIMRLIHSHFDETSSAAKEVMEGLADEYSDMDSISEENFDSGNEAPIIRMVNAILNQGVQERASDIHIEPYEKKLDIRYRIDGILHRRLSPPKSIHAGLVSRIKIMSHLNIAENRLPQDGRIKLRLAGKDIDIRVSSIPTRYGERIVMRLLNKSDTSYSMNTLGFLPYIQKSLETILKEPNGIVLVTGPTGSGKTTTLYAFLSELNNEIRNIITVEDPVEYEIEGISQMQMQEKIGLTFANSLRSILRQDPDVIMVGEIRDKETAKIAIQASLTGHLVFSTLHTNDASSAITRLSDMGIEGYLITSTLRAIIAQRLVRLICPDCKTSYRPSPGELRDVGLTIAKLKGGKLYRGKGCDSCVHTGYKGRLGIYELLVVDEPLQKAILQGSDSETMKRIAVKNKMMTLLDYGLVKVIEGATTLEEVLRVT